MIAAQLPEGASVSRSAFQARARESRHTGRRPGLGASGRTLHREGCRRPRRWGAAADVLLPREPRRLWWGGELRAASSPRRDGPSQRPADPWPDPLGGRRPRPPRRDPGRLGAQADACAEARGAATGGARAAETRRGDGGAAAGTAAPARHAAAVRELAGAGRGRRDAASHGAGAQAARLLGSARGCRAGDRRAARRRRPDGPRPRRLPRRRAQGDRRL